MVAGSYLGTISHTLTAINVLALRNLTTAAIVVSETPGSPVPLDDTVASINRFGDLIDVIAAAAACRRHAAHPAIARPSNTALAHTGSGSTSRWCRGLPDPRAPCAASLSGYFWFTGIFTAPLCTTANRSLAQSQQILARRGVVDQRRPRHEQRALLLQQQRIERRHRARRIAEGRRTCRADAGNRASRESVLADAVIDHVAQLAAGDLLHPRDEILVAIKDDVVAAIRLGELGLFLRADGADDGGAERAWPTGR